MALILIKHGLHHAVEETKLRCAADGDDVVLVQDGVFWAISEEIKAIKGKVSAIEDDFLARGYCPERSLVPLIGYAEMVDIIEAQPKTIS